MLTKRIIPCLDVKDGRVVKGKNFKGLQDAGDPIEIAQAYERQKADELVFLDITASIENRDILLDVVSKTAACVFMPLTVGGGIRSLADIRRLLNAGADKVSINSSAVHSPQLIKEASLKFGSQCIVVAIDAKKTALYAQSHKCWEVFINAGSTPSGLDAVQWAKAAEKLGAGEILLTSIDYDGTKNGYDIELTGAITSSVNIPVIASGGAGKKEHFYEVLTRAHADAALAASLFHYQELTVGQVKQYLQSKGVLVR